jgi:ketosteroid isomerase-like protein
MSGWSWVDSRQRDSVGADAQATAREDCAAPSTVETRPREIELADMMERPAPGATQRQNPRRPIDKRKTACRLLAVVAGLALLAAACSDDNATTERVGEQGVGADEGNAATTDDEADAAQTAELEESLDAFDRAFAEGRLDEFSAFFADDAQLLLNEEGAVTGTEAIGAFFASAFDSFDYSAYEAQYDITDVHGDRAYVLGTYDELICPRHGGTGTRIHGRIVLFWRAEGDGTWKVVRVLTARSAPERREDCSP